MANLWNETLTIAGPGKIMAEITSIFRIEDGLGGVQCLDFYWNDEFEMCGHVCEYEQTSNSIRVIASMRRKPVAAFFDEICDISPGLWLSSSCASALDNRRHVVAGFGRNVCVNVNESIHEGDWNPLPNDVEVRIEKLWQSIGVADEAAIEAFKSGAEIPADAIQIATLAAAEYGQ